MGTPTREALFGLIGLWVSVKETQQRGIKSNDATGIFCMLTVGQRDPQGLGCHTMSWIMQFFFVNPPNMYSLFCSKVTSEKKTLVVVHRTLL